MVIGLKIGYIKKVDQDKSSSDMIHKMESLGVDKIILEVNTQENSTQSTLMETISEMTAEDLLIINELDELGNSFADCIERLKQLEAKDIGIIILDDNYDHKTVSIENFEFYRFLRSQMINILTWAEKKEKDDINQRELEAISELKLANSAKRGRGRPKKYAKDAEDPEDRKTYHQVIAMLQEDYPVTQISDTLDISRNTIYSIKEEIEENNEEHLDS